MCRSKDQRCIVHHQARTAWRIKPLHQKNEFVDQEDFFEGINISEYIRTETGVIVGMFRDAVSQGLRGQDFKAYIANKLRLRVLFSVHAQ